MKILVTGQYYTEIYEKPFYDGFKNLEYEVYAFKWHSYFKGYPFPRYFSPPKSSLKSFYYKAQNKFLYGPSIGKLNSDFVKECIRIKPDIVFVYRGSHLYPRTLKKIKKRFNAIILGYNNDDPFSDIYPWYYWRHFLKGLQYYDHLFAYRQKNIEDYKNLGYDNCSLLRSYYLSHKNFPIEKTTDSLYRSDVIFIGHWENDGRDEAIKLLIQNGTDVKVYGTLWEESKYYEFFKEKVGEITALYKDYNLALNSSKIALVFLSRVNSDTYTRRCFEIPAAKTMMMAEYTNDLASMFEEGQEAEYFRNNAELLKKIQVYLKQPQKIRTVGSNGYKRLKKDGHEAEDRCKEVIKIFNEIKKGLN
jgi:spore maturation protein CgeB